jgi:hypothetical protein
MKQFFAILFIIGISFWNMPFLSAEETPASTAAEQEKTEKKWEYPPVIQVQKWGSEYKIFVEPNILMDRNKIETIQTIKLEKPTGEFLGLQSFGPGDTKRRAEFMLSPEHMKLKKMKVVVASSIDGEWSQVIPLKETPPVLTAYTPAEPKKKETSAAIETSKKEMLPPAQKSLEKPKKKFLFF